MPQEHGAEVDCPSTVLDFVKTYGFTGEDAANIEFVPAPTQVARLADDSDAVVPRIT